MFAYKYKCGPIYYMSASEEKTKILNNLKIIYNKINEQISYLLIEKIKKVAIEALQKIQPAVVSEEKKEEDKNVHNITNSLIITTNTAPQQQQQEQQERQQQKTRAQPTGDALLEATSCLFA